MKKLFLSISILAVAAASAAAQSTLSTFFADNNVYSYRINPAMAGEKGFVGFIINNVQTEVGSNLSLGSFLYPSKNGGLVTFLNNEVPADVAVKRFKKNTAVFEDLNLSLLSVGWWTKNGVFNNLEFNIRESMSVGLPKSVFELMKIGSSDTPYDLSSMNVGLDSRLEFAYGFSKKVNDKLSIGARLKFHAGIAKGGISFNKAQLTFNEQEISYNVDGTMKFAAPMISFGHKTSSFDPDRTVIDFSKLIFNKDRIGFSGYGGALDLGVTYKPIKDLTLSLAIQDLGIMYWNHSVVGSSVGTHTYTGVNMDIAGNGSKVGDAISDEMQEFLNDLQSLMEFRQITGKKSEGLEMMPLRVNAGLRYRMPFYNRLSVGAIAQYRQNPSSVVNKWYDVRAGVTITPIDWFSISGNYGCSTAGLTWGSVLSLNFAGINFMLGLEGYSGKCGRLTWSDVPLLNRPISVKYPLGSFRYSLNFGFTITFGERHNEFVSKKKKA